MIQTIKKDITSVMSGIICHQVNCKRKMGAGLALQIRRKWPQVYKDYMNARQQLGDVIYTEVTPGLWVASLFGQDTYGRSGRHTDYLALTQCFKDVASRSVPAVYVPFKMGCTLGGGNWTVVFGLLRETLPNAIICQFGDYSPETRYHIPKIGGKT